MARWNYKGAYPGLSEKQKVEYFRVKNGDAPIRHTWDDPEWEELRMDKAWADRGADLLFMARGFPLADFEDEVSPRVDLVEELVELTQVALFSPPVLQMTQGWLELDQGSSMMGGGIGTRGGVYSVWSDIGPTMGFVYGVGHGTGTGTPGRTALENRATDRSRHLDAQGSIVS